MNEAALGAVGLYAGLCMLILFWLANETGKLRRKHMIVVGDGGNKHLAKIMRGHLNAAENMPVFLVMLAIAAMTGVHAVVIHALGITFTIGRALHAWHFVRERAPLWQRFAGYGIAALVTFGLALWLIGAGLWSLVG